MRQAFPLEGPCDFLITSSNRFQPCNLANIEWVLFFPFRKQRIYTALVIIHRIYWVENVHDLYTPYTLSLQGDE